MRIESYATLLNKKLLIKSKKENYIAVETHYLVSCLRRYVNEIYVDTDWYLAQHPDVKEAIERGDCADACDHYAMHGFYEHRMPYWIQVSEAWYLSEYDDVRAAVQQGYYPTGQSHFEELGYREGRFPYPNFLLRCRSDKG